MVSASIKLVCYLVSAQATRCAWGGHSAQQLCLQNGVPVQGMAASC